MPKTYDNLVNIVAGMPPKLRIPVVRFTINRAIKYYANITITGSENLKARKNKPTLFISNHLSNIDGPLLNMYLRPYQVAFVAGVKLQGVNLTKFIADTMETITIKPNTADKSAIKKSVQRMKEGKSVFIFPEGTRSRTSSMIEAKKGFTLIARLSRVDILPIAITGTEKLLPINDDDMGRETFNHADVSISFGKAFSLPDRNKFSGADYAREAADYCMGKIARMLPECYRGVYAKS